MLIGSESPQQASVISALVQLLLEPSVRTAQGFVGLFLKEFIPKPASDPYAGEVYHELLALLFCTNALVAHNPTAFTLTPAFLQEFVRQFYLSGLHWNPMSLGVFLAAIQPQAKSAAAPATKEPLKGEPYAWVDYLMKNNPAAFLARPKEGAEADSAKVPSPFFYPPLPPPPPPFNLPPSLLFPFHSDLLPDRPSQPRLLP